MLTASKSNSADDNKKSADARYLPLRIDFCYSLRVWWSCRILPPGPKYHMVMILRA